MKKAILIFVLPVFFGTAVCFAQIPYGSWYKGDLHSHTLYSDGDSTVAAVIARAEETGFDFFAITDHDTSMGGNPVHWLDPSYRSDTMTLLYGVEWTTPKGHANIWAAGPFDYTPLWQANRRRDASAACNTAHANDALFSINHPTSIFVSPWAYDMFDCIDSVEVWNGMYRFPSFNRWAGNFFWDSILQSGRRITGVGGSDTHQLERWQTLFLGHGNPTTWVFAADQSAPALIAGIQHGHVSISYAPEAPRLEFTADVNGDGVDDAMMGDSAEDFSPVVSLKISVVNDMNPTASTDGLIIELNTHTVKKIAAGHLSFGAMLDALSPSMTASRRDVLGVGVFKNGRLFKVWLLIGSLAEMVFRDHPAPGTYYRVELLGKPDVALLPQLLYGRVIALTNPIYFGYPQ